MLRGERKMSNDRMASAYARLKILLESSSDEEKANFLREAIPELIDGCGP